MPQTWSQLENEWELVFSMDRLKLDGAGVAEGDAPLLLLDII